jgi:hypothetical protein
VAEPGPRARSSSSRGLLRLLIGLLAVDVILAWLVLAGLVVLLERVWLGAAGYVIRDSALRAHARQLTLILGLQALGGLLTAIVFVAWAARARRNLHALGPSSPEEEAASRDRPAGGPPRGLPLWRPYRLMRRLSVEAEVRPPARRVGWWWAVLLAMVALDLIGRTLVLARGSSLALVEIFPLAVAAECLKIATAALTMVLVLRITEAQGLAFDRQGAEKP